MAIELVEADEVRSGRGGKTKGEKYSKYAVGIQKSIPWIEEQIANSSDGVIRIKTKDMGNEMGGEFVKKADGSIYWGLKYVLFQEGIVVDTGTHSNGDKLLIMRKANDEDRLPASLAKYLEPSEEEDVVTPEDPEVDPEAEE
jgi:hypothetical protein